jgi:serine/threonine-protein kinase
LGDGVWGSVSEAVDPQGRRVALKELRAPLMAGAEARRRFAAVAPVLTSVDHPHVVRVIQYIDGDDRCVLVSELIGGGTLRERARAGVSPEVACALVLAVASGVERARRAGVLHRDLKPENVLFTGGVAKVSDFGLAEIVSGPRTLATREGTVLGAPAYMAPELVRSEEPRAASDVYALGTILYELLAGRLPFAVDANGLTTMARHVQEAPVDLVTATPGVPPPVAGVAMRGLAADPGDRYASADEFGAALADAAATAWGAGWLRQTGVTVSASEAVTERLRATRALEVPVVAETLAPPAPAPAAPAAPPPPPPQPLAPQPSAADDPAETMAAPAVQPAAAAAPPPPAPPPPKSRRGVIIAVVAAVVIVGAVLAFALTRSSGAKSTVIGPKTVNVSGQVPWTNTGIVLQANDDVSITATGTVFPNTGNRALAATPDGVPNHPEIRQFNLIPNTDHSGLIGRVGDAGAPFVVGHAAHIHASTAGALFLGINDVGLDNNGGAFAATVTVTRK